MTKSLNQAITIKNTQLDVLGNGTKERQANKKEGIVSNNPTRRMKETLGRTSVLFTGITANRQHYRNTCVHSRRPLMIKEEGRWVGGTPLRKWQSILFHLSSCSLANVFARYWLSLKER